jgi:hypothetical protein
MAGAFTLAASAISKDQIFPASITKIEFRENGGASDQYQSMGDIDDGVFDVTPAFQAVSARQQRQIGFNLNFTGNLTVTGDAMRAALKNVLLYVVDLRFTDINGHVFVLAGEASGIKFDLVFGENISASNDASQSRKFPITGSGFATGTKWDTLFSVS